MLSKIVPWIEPFFTLSYPTEAPPNPDSFPTSKYYNTGPRDVFLILTWMAVLGALREVVRLGISEPFARWWLSGTHRLYVDKRKDNANGHSNGHANGHSNGHSNGYSNGHANGHANGSLKNANGNGHAISKGKRMSKRDRLIERNVTRFAEQAWPFVYYSVYWTFGMWLHMNLPTAPFRPTQLWTGYPHIPLAAPLKFYYLTQIASWFHQLLILNAEARRKDHIQMMAHHFITIGLTATSYFSNFTRVGCQILVLMDWCDIILPLAKMLRYLSFEKACDVAFGVFLVTWLITRHILLTIVIYSTYADAPRYIPFKWDPPNGLFLNYNAYIGFVALLVALQILLCIWLWMIGRVAWNVLTGKPAEDTRSDEEDLDGSDSPLSEDDVRQEAKKDR